MAFENPNRLKAELAAELETSRARLARDLKGLAFEADVPAKFRRSFRSNFKGWLFGAALTGWVVSRLPARSKKRALPTAKGAVARGGLFLGLIKLIFFVAKPLVTALLTRKLATVADSMAKK